MGGGGEMRRPVLLEWRRGAAVEAAYPNGVKLSMGPKSVSYFIFKAEHARALALWLWGWAEWKDWKDGKKKPDELDRGGLEDLGNWGSQ